jgi:phosphatidylglycerol:prolipoprotein diacylglycerol transferase
MGWRKKIPFAVMADTGAPSMLLGHVIGRFGNFFNREAFGGYTDSLFAMRLRVDQVPQPRHITQELRDNIYTVYHPITSRETWETVAYHTVDYIQVHPTFLYELALNFIIMVALLIYRPHKRFDGEIVLLYFLGYGVIRFIVESFRTDQMILFDTGLPLNQVTAVLFAVVSAALLTAGYLRVRNPNIFRRKKR